MKNLGSWFPEAFGATIQALQVVPGGPPTIAEMAASLVARLAQLIEQGKYKSVAGKAMPTMAYLSELAQANGGTAGAGGSGAGVGGSGGSKSAKRRAAKQERKIVAASVADNMASTIEASVQAAVGAAFAAKGGKGHGGKGGGFHYHAKGGGKGQQFQGTCDHCGIWGHKRADCRNSVSQQPTNLLFLQPCSTTVDDTQYLVVTNYINYI